ncbi:hypothetical protein DAPPUDRAFT_240281 [Daphnia pulex]|uniref:Uncharacterized protein n=1 Tax=Daphnia pulex TaxID=6669 RepID=E9GC27_DAPPU|nr:hypothetical protein DAPPUDRAFT_240281 [Daphnia pulex]|eukprot:EFX83218.1 hypothetical protein DAPPUDRAFT_240281 [Daphnia pulex]
MSYRTRLTATGIPRHCPSNTVPYAPPCAKILVRSNDRTVSFNCRNLSRNLNMRSRSLSLILVSPTARLDNQ